MAKLSLNTVITNKDGDAIDMYDGSGVSRMYEIIPEGYYYGIVESVGTGTFKSKKSGVDYLKITPRIRLLNDNGTILDREDLTVSAVRLNDRGEVTEMYRPDGNKEKTPLFGGRGSALQFFAATGILTYTDDDKGAVSIDADTDQLRGIVIKVLVNTKTFKRNDGTEGRKNIAAGFFNPTVRDGDMDEVRELVPDAVASGKTLFANDGALEAFSVAQDVAASAGYNW